MLSENEVGTKSEIIISYFFILFATIVKRPIYLFTNVSEMKEKNEAEAEVLNRVKKQDVKFIRLWFTDILGQLKSFAIPPKNWRRLSQREWVLTVLP